MSRSGLRPNVARKCKPMIGHRRNLSRSGYWPNVAKKWCPLLEDFVSLRTLTKCGPNCAPHWRTLSCSGFWPNVVKNVPLIGGLNLTADFNQMWSKMCPSLEDFVSLWTLTRFGLNMCPLLENFLQTNVVQTCAPWRRILFLLRSLTTYGSTMYSSSKKAGTKQIGL